MIPDATAAAALLDPASVAVIGDSPSDRAGGLLHAQLVRRGFRGTLVPVNPRYDEIRGLPAHPDLRSYGGQVDFAAIALGPDQAVDTMRDCVEAGARAVLFVGSGFAEVGGPGAAVQRELRTLADRHGIALAGPNCYGLANVRAGFAPFFGALPEPLVAGPVALVSGSGALTHAIGDVLAARGTGLGYVITVGNEAGVQAADYLQLIAGDPEIRAVACYLEAIRDADALATGIAALRAAGKQVVVLTVGRSEASRAASAAHTGALAGEARVAAAFLRDLGAVVVHDLDELVETVELASQVGTIGSGPVTIGTISGGGCGVLADVAADVGLALAPLEERTTVALRAVVPGDGALANPVDLTGAAIDDPRIIEGALQALDDCAADLGLHLFALNTPTGATATDRALYQGMADAVIATGARLRAPVALFTLTSGTLDPVITSAAHAAGVPVLQGARESLAAVARLQAVGPPRPLVVPALSPPAQRAATLLARSGASVLPQSAAADVLAAAGVPMARGELVPVGGDAAAAAVRVGLPVVAKIESVDVLHKSDVGCVLLDLHTPEEAAAAAATVLARAAALGARVDGVRIEQQLPEGVAALVGVVVDPTIGPAVVIGAGGVLVELVDDSVVLPAPTTAVRVRAALGRLKLGVLLAGTRGRPAVDTEALVELVVAVSEFAWAARDDLAALDLNPVFVHEHGAVALDAVLLRKEAVS